MGAWLELVRAAAAVGILAALAVAAVMDARKRVIPNACSVTVAAFAAIDAAARGAQEGAVLPALAGAAVSTAAVFALLLLTVNIHARIWGGAGVGGGDIKLLTAMAAWTGLERGLALVWAVCALVALKGVLMCVLCGLSRHKPVISTGRNQPAGQALAPTVLLVTVAFVASRALGAT